MLLWPSVYLKYLFKFLLSLLLGIYPKMEVLSHIVIAQLIFWGTAILWCIILHPQQQYTKVLISLHPHHNVPFSAFLIITILVLLLLSRFSHPRLFATPWTAACQAPLSMGFSRQEYWSGYPFPSPGDLPNPGIKPRSPTLQADSVPAKPQGKPLVYYI